MCIENVSIPDGAQSASARTQGSVVIIRSI
jgi:hypothetical protein